MTWLCQKQAARNRKRGPAVAHLNPNEDASRNNNLPPAGLYGLLALPCPRLSDRLLHATPSKKQVFDCVLVWCVERARGARLIDCVLQDSWIMMVSQVTGLSLCTGSLGMVLLLFLFSLGFIFPMEVVRKTGGAPVEAFMCAPIFSQHIGPPYLVLNVAPERF